MGNLFYEKVKAICAKEDKVLFFVDMDGVLAEFEFFTKEYLEKNENNLFRPLRPLTKVIDCLEKINEISNVELFILSLCRYEDDEKQKREWLDTHAPFFKLDNVFILKKEQGEYTDANIFEIKGDFIKNKIKDEHIIFLEDTHANLKEAKKLLGEQISIFHISSLID